MTFLWGVLDQTVQDSIDQALRPEVIDLNLSIQPYDLLFVLHDADPHGYNIQIGPIGAPARIGGTKLRGEPDEVERKLGEGIVGSIIDAVKGDVTTEVVLELTDFKLRSSRPLSILVRQPSAAAPAQTEPGARILSEREEDLYKFFESGRFFDRDCMCIHVVLRDDTGRFVGGPDRTYFVEEKASFSAQSLVTTLHTELRREHFTISVIIKTPGASAESGERAKVMIYGMLQEGLVEEGRKRNVPIRVSSFQTQEALEQERKRLNEMPRGPDKSRRLSEVNVDQVVMVTATVQKDWFFQR